jgi:uncharacterized damage-inducible protein DinB
MTISHLLLQDFDAAISNTRRTLERIPEGKNDWKCHDKSMAMGKLAMHCATLPIFGHYILEDDSMDLAKPKRPQQSFEFTTAAAAMEKLDECAKACRDSIAATSDEAFSKPWRFTFGEHLISEMPRSTTFRVMCFNHLIHHTAQLGVYLRLNDIPVPALYGPSADDQWSA